MMAGIINRQMFVTLNVMKMESGGIQWAALRFSIGMRGSDGAYACAGRGMKENGISQC